MGNGASKPGKKNMSSRDAPAHGSSGRNRRLSVAGGSHSSEQASSADEKASASSGSTGRLRFATLSQAGFEPDGVKKENQDSFIAIPKLGDSMISLFGVYDGHGALGHFVSQYTKRELPKVPSRLFLIYSNSSFRRTN
jgi:hypothetical protein